MAKVNQYFPQSVPHPGVDLAEKLEELGMGSKEFAIRTGKPEKTITALLNGDSSITPDMAVQFENVLRIPAHFWLNRQRSYDESVARKKRSKVVELSADWARCFPYAEMVKKEWVSPAHDIHEKTSSMLAFFGFSSHKAWENYYLKQQLKVAFRISLAHTKEPYAISAWLRKGELQAAELSVKKFSERAFKKSLEQAKSIMARHSKTFFKDLQTTTAEAGVKVVYTPCLPKAPITGSARWLKDTPLIQLTGRYNRNDSFWFTFFHEAGHILLHGKKDVFLEEIEYSDKDNQKEQEADAFAIKWTLTEEQEEEIIAAAPLTEGMIRLFAEEFNTHPALIIGRLQHKKLVPYALGRNLILPLEF